MYQTMLCLFLICLKVDKVYKTRLNLLANPKLGRGMSMNRDSLPNIRHS